MFEGPYSSLDETDRLRVSRRIVSCTKAYQDHDLKHIAFEAKEHLGVLNGTAFSAGVAGLALNDALQLGILALMCTAMGTEALLGTQGQPDLVLISRDHPRTDASIRFC